MTTLDQDALQIVEQAFGLLWAETYDNRTRSGAAANKARRLLGDLIGKDGKARGIAAARNAATPIAQVINNNQPGWTNVIETAPNVTLDVGTPLYLAPPGSSNTGVNEGGAVDQVEKDYREFGGLGKRKAKS